VRDFRIRAIRPITVSKSRRSFERSARRRRRSKSPRSTVFSQAVLIGQCEALRGRRRMKPLSPPVHPPIEAASRVLPSSDLDGDRARMLRGEFER
jgi:hypothetical protein